MILNRLLQLLDASRANAPWKTGSEFRLLAERLSNSFSQGSLLSRQAGLGRDYLQSRPYIPSDAQSRVDWRATARMDEEIYSKEFEARRQTKVLQLVDNSLSMVVSSLRTRKIDWAMTISQAICRSARRQGIQQNMFATDPNGYGIRNTSIVDTSSKKFRVNCLQYQVIVVISDLHNPHLKNFADELRHNSDVIVIQLVDPVELTGINAGLVNSREAETKRTIMQRGKLKWLDSECINHEDTIVLQTGDPTVEMRLVTWFRNRAHRIERRS